MFHLNILILALSTNFWLTKMDPLFDHKFRVFMVEWDFFCDFHSPWILISKHWWFWFNEWNSIGFNFKSFTILRKKIILEGKYTTQINNPRIISCHPSSHHLPFFESLYVVLIGLPTFIILLLILNKVQRTYLSNELIYLREIEN